MRIGARRFVCEASAGMRLQRGPLHPVWKRVKKRAGWCNRAAAETTGGRRATTDTNVCVRDEKRRWLRPGGSSGDAIGSVLCSVQGHLHGEQDEGGRPDRRLHPLQRHQRDDAALSDLPTSHLFGCVVSLFRFRVRPLGLAVARPKRLQRSQCIANASSSMTRKVTATSQRLDLTLDCQPGRSANSDQPWLVRHPGTNDSRRRTKEMMQPCLICLHAISLVARLPARAVSVRR